MRARRGASAVLALAAASLLLGLLSGCGSGTSTVVFKSKAEAESAKEAGEAEAGGEAPPQVPSELSIETAAGFDAAQIYREASPGVVTIRSVFGGGNGAEGSGFVLDEEGEIVTNAHVVTEQSGQEGSREPASEVFVEFPSRDVLEAQIVGFDPFADVALLRVEKPSFALHPLALGNDTELEVGEPVAAIGSPFGEQRSLSVGVVSATHRSVKSLTQFLISGAIQTDASINPGNSGGPLLEGDAKVIGINQQIETGSGTNDGVGFAVPISAVRRSIAQLREDGTVEYPYVGVSTEPLYPQLAEKLGIDAEFGALVAKVVPGGPAAEAGLKGADGTLRFQAAEYETGGDVIVEIDGEEVTEPESLIEAIAAKKPGDKVDMTILRDNQAKHVTVTLGKRPDRVE